MIQWYIKTPEKLPYTGKYPRACDAIDRAAKKYTSRFNRKTKGDIWIAMKDKGYRLIEVVEFEHP